MRENDLYKEVSRNVMPDFDDIKKKVVSSKIKKRNYKPFIAAAACLAVAVGGAALLSNSGVLSHNEKSIPNASVQAVEENATSAAIMTTMPDLLPKEETDKIVYNKLGGVGSCSLAASCETKNHFLGSFCNLIAIIPEELSECSFDEIFVVPKSLEGTQAMQDINNYTVLHTCQLRFVKPNSSDKVIVSFSDKGEPLRDIIYECGKKESLINGQKIVLTGDIKDGLCLANFYLEENGKKIYFDIEFSGVTEEEMLSVLNEIINMSGMGNFFTMVCEEKMTEPPAGAETNTPEEIFSNAHITTEAPVTEFTTENGCYLEPPLTTESVSEGYTVNIEKENEDNAVISAPAFEPSAVCGNYYD